MPIVVCPICKTVLPVLLKMPKIGTQKTNETCPHCNKKVRGRVTDHISINHVEPIHKDVKEEEANIISNSIPALDAISTIGNSNKVGRFILVRIALFGFSFFAFHGIFTITLTNPYFLVLVSSVSLIMCHIIHIISNRSNIMKSIADWGILGMFPLLIYLFFIIGPLILFEILLLASNPLFIIGDILVGILSMLLIIGNDKT